MYLAHHAVQIAPELVDIRPLAGRRIREKIEINPKEPRYLKVVWGIGYKIEKI